MHQYTYLALGDSYTIGEQVTSAENFPNQTVKLLNKEEKYHFQEPKIIATTGWTTDELIKGIEAANIANEQYDFVTLLIGVNNQYRNYSIETYAQEFEILLDKAILYANNMHNRVIVISIPDWGVTPFAKEKNVNVDETSLLIDQFNNINKSISIKKNVHYLDITFSTRFHGIHEEYLTEDLLHYSAKEYAIWAEQLSKIINQQISAEML